MTKELFYKWGRSAAAGSRWLAPSFASVLVFVFVCAPRGLASSDAPQWLHDLANAPLPAHSAKADAVLLYSETNVTVLSADRIRTHVREAYKILRPGGRERGNVYVYFDSHKKISYLRGWCIPAHGKDYAVTDRDAIDQSPMAVRGYELVYDTKIREVKIPAPDPGNVVGYEYEIEEQPFFLQDSWAFQEVDPLIESRYSLQLPPGWEFKASWIHHAEVAPLETGTNQWQWAVKEVKAIVSEEDMPPRSGVAGQMIVSFFPSGGTPQHNEFADWNGMGQWYRDLAGNRNQASEQIKQEVAALTAAKTSPLEKMQALAQFMQQDIRYVAIELGIGGWQPHPAPDIFFHRYGDCKDKATLMISMLREIGIEAHYVIINAYRDAVTRDEPAHNAFNHAITAITLPNGLSDPSLVATLQHPKLGKILFFDPTDELTPFGYIRGQLQANYGLLVTPDGGELLQLPRQRPEFNGIQRTGTLVLDASGNLQGKIREIRLGDRALDERRTLRNTTKESDRIKPVEQLLADSLATFQITSLRIANVMETDRPLVFDYSFQAPGYAHAVGDMLLVRPRILGSKSSGILETAEPRRFAIELASAVSDSDTFEISLPPGYRVVDLAPPVDADFDFASYHSKTEVSGNTLRYVRKLELKELTVPANHADELKKFYRIINTDEQSTVVLKRQPLTQAPAASPASNK
ncbi:MAG: DUF3857 domain-containing transglutaminase family protein [Terriglobales bacterium]